MLLKVLMLIQAINFCFDARVAKSIISCQDTTGFFVVHQSEVQCNREGVCRVNLYKVKILQKLALQFSVPLAAIMYQLRNKFQNTGSLLKKQK
jgi:hypothetical protein